MTSSTVGLFSASLQPLAPWLRQEMPLPRATNIITQTGTACLAEKLKKNGKHQVGKAGKEAVTAEVSNG